MEVMIERVQKNKEEIEHLRERFELHEREAEGEIKEIKRDINELKTHKEITQLELVKIQESVKSITMTLERQETKQSERHRDFYGRFDGIKESFVRFENELNKKLLGVMGTILLYILYEIIKQYMGGK